ncbi:MAG: hypothetical protein M0Q13_05780 [Methanothrix sp.]|jgi:hypothetical protein|nr:hypothetical protein [Methanothrix sp.]
MSIVDDYRKLQKEDNIQISKKGVQKKGFIDDFNTSIWTEKLGFPIIKCIPIISEFEKENIGEEIDTEVPPSKKGKVQEKDKIYGVPIIKMTIGNENIRNPITIDNIKESYKFFGIPKEHFKGLKEIVITDEIPTDKWAFGTYNIRKKGDKYIDNRITIWAQSIKTTDGEIRYIIYPSNVPGPMFLKSERFFYEILGDTIIHELGHHYDLWINESPMGGSGWIIRAENAAEKYVRSFSAIKRRSEDFLSIMRKLGEADNKDYFKELEKKDNDNKLKDVNLDDNK